MGMLYKMWHQKSHDFKRIVICKIWIDNNHVIIFAKQAWGPFLAPAVTVGETEGAMDPASVFFASSFAYNFVRK